MADMEYRDRKSTLLKEIEPVITGLGYSLVDFTDRHSGSNLHIDIVIYRESGITLDDCSLVHRAVLPRMEMLEETRDIYLEVSSPGMSRNIKTVDELIVFSGRRIKILLTDESEWITGRISSADKDSLTLKTKDDTLVVNYDTIRKAKLD